MDYGEAVRYLLALGSELAAPRQPAAAGPKKIGLANIRALAERLGNPHAKYPSVHVAGTNGKGSTAAMIESILRAAGMKTGLFTSPHLERINERIRIAGAEISDPEFAQVFTRLLQHIEQMLISGPEEHGLPAHPTFFECLTAMAFDCFAQERVDFAVFEVGMGGRLDSTNIIIPEVAVITQIDFDHENYLGHSIEAIAGEKAGIIKPGVPVVCAAGREEARAVVARRAEELGVPLVDIDDRNKASTDLQPITGAASGIWLQPSLPGRFQLRNALTAAAAALLLRKRGFAISAEAISIGIAQTRWPGRLEQIQANGPTIFLDGTHNPAGARELLAFWDEHFPGRRIHLVYGAVRDKAVDEIASLLFPRAASVILTQPAQPRVISAAVLAEMTAHLNANTEVVVDPAEALERAMARAAPEDVVFATGSLYLVGELRRWWRARMPAPTRTT